MNINPIIKLALAGVGVAALATTIGLQVVTLNVATNAAAQADRAIMVAESANEAPAGREQVVTDEHPAFFAIYTLHHALAPYKTVSITYERADGEPLTAGGFEAVQSNNGLVIEKLEGTPAGDYRVVVNQLTPSEIDHDLIFLVTVK